MAILPAYLKDQTEETIRQRMLDSLPSDLDKSEGSFLWDALAPASIELAQAAIWAQEVLRRGFASTTFGSYLDLRCEEHGLTRRPAVKARGQVKFTGTAGASVPAGTRVATPADRVTGASSVEFLTKASAVLDGAGTATVYIEAVEAGASGNVSSRAISLLMTPVSGVTTVTNLTVTEGGADTESDESLRSRYLQKVRSPSAGGNKADYINWALEVAGVGGVSVVPVRDGPGTVSVSIINTDGELASQSLVDQVQNYIAPPLKITAEAEEQSLGGQGASIDGDSVKMVYDASESGVIYQTLTNVLPKPGLWTVRVRLKADNTQQTSNVLQVSVYNATTSEWAKTSQNGSQNALYVFGANQLSEIYTEVVLPFYWNGSDNIQLRVLRLLDDTSTTLWIDRFEYRSAFSKDTGEGKAPIGAKVQVESAAPVWIHVTAGLVVAEGYDAASVKTEVRQNIAHYIRSLAFTEDNDVRNVRIGQAILDTTGVQDYTGLLVNGGTGNVVVGLQEVAVLGTVTLT
ncbi:baseplate J/gp47 family protein [Paenibacillus hodogayensis]|uniref:Baseplate J/gp47 family protein n=1 Tax=Paenibacillus hodogayensis TaxID=279208 RepID=A0ABV5W137_9BACL